MLPAEVVAKILQHVPEQLRFSNCALVSRSWHTAALAAANRLTVHLPQQAQLNSLGSWLQQHGTALKVLSMSSTVESGSYNVVLLAIQQLQDLESLSLESLGVDVDPVIASRPLGQCLSGITSLGLDGVHLHTDNCIELLPQLTSLRHVRLSGVRAAKDDKLVEDHMQRALENWTQLTSLVLDNPGFGDGVLKSLGKLTQLKLLQIRKPYLSTDTLSLPLSLTCLEFISHDNGCHDLSAQLFATQLCKLVQLQHLSFRCCYVDCKTALAALLAALPQLKQLKHLSLHGSLRCSVDTEQYTALVSSSQLTYLDLTDCWMPQNAVFHMFAAGNQHSALQTFQIGHLLLWTGWTVCGGAFNHLVGCCPQLAVLHLGYVIQPEYVNEMTVLEQLTNLRKLTLSGKWVFDIKLVDMELPALRDLEITSSYSRIEPKWTASGVLNLRDMTQLTRLKLLQCRERSAVCFDVDWCVEFIDRVSLSDLRERMYNAFKDNGNFAKVLLLEQKQDCATAVRSAVAAEQMVQAAEQRAVAAQQRAEAAEQKAAAAQQRAEAAEQTAQAAEQRAQDAKQWVEAAEQRVEAAEQRAVAAEQRAEAAEQRAEVAEQKAEAAEQRAEATEQRAVAAEEMVEAAEQRAAAAEEMVEAAEQKAEVAEQGPQAAEHRAQGAEQWVEAAEQRPR